MKLSSKLGLAMSVVVTDTVTSFNAHVPCGPATRNVVMPLSSIATLNVCTLEPPAAKFKVRLPFTEPTGVATAALRLVTVTDAALVAFINLGIATATTTSDWPGLPLTLTGAALMHDRAVGKTVLTQALSNVAVTVSPIARVYAPNSKTMPLDTGNAT